MFLKCLLLCELPVPSVCRGPSELDFRAVKLMESAFLITVMLLSIHFSLRFVWR